ncbi:hypothetical protein M7I_8277 [Glarea lozoyensis 74030]|uniref:EthD domain-containing protein n=1 Tax=Glarea lozoyensis (strain ATCC 74030 / MF5533) TaxID=1104152 RepID=H0EZK3_GLAL7|nr:hypothetical protein M7I_8277 [Glarea lozoyensis 74030]
MLHVWMIIGILFHATYIDSKWVLEQRDIRDVSASKSLVLLYHLHTISAPSDEQLFNSYEKMQKVVQNVPMGRKAREDAYGETRAGNPELDGYDCVIWTGDAMRALIKEGLIDLQGRDVEEVMAEARSLAGPEDAKTMVGVDFGGLKIM